MTTTNQTISAKDTVLSFIMAMNDEDFKTAKSYASDDITFEGVMGSRHGADAYFKDMEKMKFKYDIKKIFENSEDVCLFYDISMSGLIIFSSGWYHVEDGKIMWFKVIFDPRPILELSGKK